MTRGDPFDRLLSDPRFRGLWRSRELQKDGTLTSGWSVTFGMDSDFVEIAYEPTAEAAVKRAIEAMKSFPPWTKKLTPVGG